MRMDGTGGQAAQTQDLCTFCLNGSISCFTDEGSEVLAHALRPCASSLRHLQRAREL